MRLTLSVVALVAGVAAALGAQSDLRADFRAREERTFDRTLRFAGSGERTLQVRVNTGTIRITGGSGSEVQVEARQIFEGRTASDVRDAQREVTIETADDATTVDVVVREDGRNSCGDPQPRWTWDDWSRRRYEVTTDLTIRAPRDARLRVCTISGTAVIDGIVGDFDVTTVNGRVTMSGLQGSGRATTVNGSVRATFARAPRGPSLFKSVNGELAVTFPRDLAADLRMKTFNGGLFTDFDVTQPAGPVPPSGERRNGRYRYRSREATTFRVGQGGPELTFETLNGDVRVLRAER